jgi:hypothetical protein
MENRGAELAVVAIAFLVASWLVVSVRVFIRGWMIKSFGTDDWLMVLTLVCLRVRIWNALLFSLSLPQI